jgi:hypothetical protein
MVERAIMKQAIAVLVAAAFAPVIWAADVSKVQPVRIARNPIVRVVTVSQAELRRGNDDLLEDTMARLQQASAFRPDIACLPELFSRRAPESVPGPATERHRVISDELDFHGASHFKRSILALHQ